MEGSATKRAKKRLYYIIGLGLASLFVLFIIYLSTGQVKLGFVESMEALSGYLQKLFQPDATLTTSEFIVGAIRLPRAIAVIGVGIALSIAGAIMQAMIRNPLGDPISTGTSSPAAGAGTPLAGVASDHDGRCYAATGSVGAFEA